MGHLSPLSLTDSGAPGYGFAPAASGATSSAAVLTIFRGCNLPTPSPHTGTLPSPSYIWASVFPMRCEIPVMGLYSQPQRERVGRPLTNGCRTLDTILPLPPL